MKCSSYVNDYYAAVNKSTIRRSSAQYRCEGGHTLFIIPTTKLKTWRLELVVKIEEYDKSEDSDDRVDEGEDNRITPSPNLLTTVPPPSPVQPWQIEFAPINTDVDMLQSRIRNMQARIYDLETNVEATQAQLPNEETARLQTILSDREAAAVMQSTLD
jgi:hypothetical protein